MGKAIMKDMVLVPGNNSLPAEFRLQPTNEQVRDGFLSGYVAGASFALDIAGGADSTPVASLKEAMASIKMASSITGITDKLIAPGTASQPDLGNMLQLTESRRTPVQVMIYNPFDTPLHIKRMKAVNSWDGKEFGVVDEDVGMTIPPKSTALSPTVTMVSPSGLGFMMSTLLPLMMAYPGLLVGAAAEVPFNIQSTIVSVLGGPDGYEGNVVYAQSDVPIKVQIGGTAPEGTMSQILGDLDPTSTTAVASPSPVASPSSVASPSPTATEAGPAPTPEPSVAEPSTTVAVEETSNAPEPTPETAALKKRQALESAPSSTDPVVVEAWVKSTVNKLAIEKGLPAPFA
ncbi:hypothetical protein BG011_001935 [Mortierella polycephala]|uniref:Uncharacterized protein n=1 Tax=Mortierella polycephala TaxID=41804 RepID=A0A9P6PKB7_9FUNG|nr:hypothetical protein BG011_001935 [Mortierella polycephala]